MPLLYRTTLLILNIAFLYGLQTMYLYGGRIRSEETVSMPQHSLFKQIVLLAIQDVEPTKKSS